MKLIKDILIIQAETSGPNTETDHIIQLSAVLLDKDNLLEKNNFNFYIKASFLDKTLMDHSDYLGITFDQLRKSPKLSEVINNFIKTFGSDPLIASHDITSYLFLQKAFKRTLNSFDYDNHYINIWSLGYIYMMHYGVKKIPTLSTLANHFNLKVKHPHNAFEKVRLTAEIFRKIVLG